MTDIKDLDLYGLLELTIDSTEQDIRSAYRKKALKCHPDKNPDDKKAAETFHLLSKAIEVLLDKSARDAYDSVIRRKEEVKIRNSKLDSTRKKFKEDLERREREAESERQNTYKASKTEEEILQNEIDRLRKEGSIRLQEEIRLMSEELRAATELKETNVRLNPENYRLRIKWKSNPEDPRNLSEEYNQESLTKIFSKYGNINILVISKKKQGSALLEFEHADSARRAKLYELGFPRNPLKLNYLNPETDRNESKNQPSNSVSGNIFNTDTLVDSKDSSSSEAAKSNLFPSTNEFVNMFPNAFNSSNKSSESKSSNIFPSANQSNNYFPSVSQPSVFPSTMKSGSLFPGATESSNIFSSAKKPSNMFPIPSQLFPSAKPSHLVLSSKKPSKDLDYEEAVLEQMRKAQEKNK